jgi:DNA-directed RNA polymerase specialized sigma24 family protein
MNLDWEYLSDLADKVARSVAAAWSVVEKDDVKQEILLHAYEKRAAIEQHYGDEDMLWRIFRKAGIQYASAERDARDLLDDRYYYTPDEAKAALRSFLYTDQELGELLGRRDDLLSCKVTDNLLSARMDAAASLKKLPNRYQNLLMTKYVYGLPVDNTADAMALSRAAVALARAMNRTLRST